MTNSRIYLRFVYRHILEKFGEVKPFKIVYAVKPWREEKDFNNIEELKMYMELNGLKLGRMVNSNGVYRTYFLTTEN